MNPEAPLVSIIIPCYKQAHYLAEAVESVLAQTYRHYEIIIVDDGSPDNVAAVAARYPAVHYIRQANQGSATARNTGWRASRGSYLVFLDADDRLLPVALAAGLNCLQQHPAGAFAFGLSRQIAPDGAPLPGTEQTFREQVDYAGLLAHCFIHHPASVIFRRACIDAVGGFDSTIPICSDLEFYLRVARTWPIHSHHTLVSEYRQHAANRSLNTAQMLKYSLDIIRRQAPYVRGNPRLAAAYRRGMRVSKLVRGGRLYREIWDRLWAGQEWQRNLRELMVLLRYCPLAFMPILGGKWYRQLKAKRVRHISPNRSQFPNNHIASGYAAQNNEQDIPW